VLSNEPKMIIVRCF